MWSSSNMTPYMSLTIHYITADWTLQSKCLETRYIPQNHTADVLAEALQFALADWELDERKMACITTDNGANIVAAIRNLGWPWLNCFGHNLHLAVSHGLDSDKDRTARAMGLCRNLVNTFNLSWLKKTDLRKAQTETNVPQHNLVLVSDDNLLYNTTYLKGKYQLFFFYYLLWGLLYVLNNWLHFNNHVKLLFVKVLLVKVVFDV